MTTWGLILMGIGGLALSILAGICPDEDDETTFFETKGKDNATIHSRTLKKKPGTSSSGSGRLLTDPKIKPEDEGILKERFYFSRLTDLQKIIYGIMFCKIRNNGYSQKLEFSLPEGVKIPEDRLKPELKAAITALYDDHPEYYWLLSIDFPNGNRETDPEKQHSKPGRYRYAEIRYPEISDSYDDDGKQCIKIQLFYRQDEVRDLDNRITLMVREIIQGTRISDKREALKTIFTRIATSFTYSQDDCESYSVAGMARRRRGVCCAYAALLILCCRKLGFSSYRVTRETEYTYENGKREVRRYGHQWAAVILDGKLYHCDPCSGLFERET